MGTSDTSQQAAWSSHPSPIHVRNLNPSTTPHRLFQFFSPREGLLDARINLFNPGTGVVYFQSDLLAEYARILMAGCYLDGHKIEIAPLWWETPTEQPSTHRKPPKASLETLPVEIRLRIFCLLFPSQTLIIIANANSQTIAPRFTQWFPERSNRFVYSGENSTRWTMKEHFKKTVTTQSTVVYSSSCTEKHSIHLLRLNHRLHNEAASVLYGENDFELRIGPIDPYGECSPFPTPWTPKHGHLTKKCTIIIEPLGRNMRYYWELKKWLAGFVQGLGEHHKLKELEICVLRRNYWDDRDETWYIDYYQANLAFPHALDVLVSISRTVEKVSISGVERAFGEKLEKVIMGEEMVPPMCGYSSAYNMDMLVQEYDWGLDDE